MSHVSTTTEPLDIDADLLSLGDTVRFPGERRRYRVGAIRRTVLIPRRGQHIADDDRARVTLDLYPISRGGSSSRRTIRPTDRVLTY